MTKELAEFLVKATEHCGSQEISIQEKYSGRGMYGRETVAVVVDDQLELLVNVVQYIKETLECMSEDFNPEQSAEFIPDVSDMGKLRTDSMGRNSVVIY